MFIDGLDKGKIHNKLIHRLAYSRDASVYRLLPKAVLRPENEFDIISILKHASREKTPVTFRTGGTSLSGQSVTEGLLVEVLQGWKNFEILENGNAIKLQPGLTGQYVNGLLKQYSRKIGPDPASIKAARIGGIVANNASGMACGISGNSYHTIRSLKFILPNGNIYNSAIKSDYEKFHQNEPEIFYGLLKLRSKILDNESLVKRIRKKYRIKNTIGYSLNAFLDFEHPMDILVHLLVGSEGTLSFISEVIFNTLPDPKHKFTDLYIFDSPDKACATLPELINLDPASIELMDKASLSTAKYLKDPPVNVSSLPNNAAALLIEFQTDQTALIKNSMVETTNLLKKMEGDSIFGWQTSEELRMKLWAIRKGLYPTVGSLRKPGTSVITEDLCYDITDLSSAVNELQNIFKRNKTQDAVIFGHAKDGNLHFVASEDLNDRNASKHYDSLMQDLVTMTVGQFDGSLKGEHGTGRNMAPFVETEWGSDLYGIMVELKKLIDPDNILNPGVILDQGNKKIHIENLKTLPPVHKEVDLCIECGFCENICPSKDLTLTPKQRIIIQRELFNLSNDSKEEVSKDFNYMGLDTCAVDGLCEISCPVNINTGEFVTHFRNGRNSILKKSLSKVISNNIGTFSELTKVSLNYTRLFRPIADKIISGPLPYAAKKIEYNSSTLNASYVYYASCLTRTLSPNDQKTNLAEILIEIGNISGKKLLLSKEIKNTCCGMPFHSKGYFNENLASLERSIEALYSISDSGKTPILIDTSPCTYQLRNAGKYLKGNGHDKWSKLTFIDISEFLWEVIKETRLPKLNKAVGVHPTCSNEKMGNSYILKEILDKIAITPIKSKNWGCCGFAGDRGYWIPELNESATKAESLDLKDTIDIGISTSRTCEIGMERATKQKFESVALLVLEYLKQ